MTKRYTAACPECGAILELPEGEMVGLWDGENDNNNTIGGIDYEVDCKHCARSWFVSELEIRVTGEDGEPDQ